MPDNAVRWIDADPCMGPWKEPGRRVTGRGGRRSRKVRAVIVRERRARHAAFMKHFDGMMAVDPVDPEDHPSWGEEEPGHELGYRERRRLAKQRRRRARAEREGRADTREVEAPLPDVLLTERMARQQRAWMNLTDKANRC